MLTHRSIGSLMTVLALSLSGPAVTSFAAAKASPVCAQQRQTDPSTSPAPQDGGRPTVEPVVRVGVRIGERAPNFRLIDIAGKRHTLSEFIGRPIVLCFFCGCTSCHALAQEWGALQKADPTLRGPVTGINEVTPESATAVLSPSGSSQIRVKNDLPAVTVVVAIGNGSKEAAQFADDTGLYKSSTVMLPDPMLAVSTDAYHVDPCPRVFVLDSDGVIRYTNDHPDDNGQTVAGEVIIKRVAAVLKKLAGPSGK